MKTFILLAFHGLLTSVTMHTVSSSDQDNLAIKQAVLIVIGGSFSPDHLGPEKFEAVRNIISDNAPRANQILLSEILNQEEYIRRLSSLHVDSLLNLTSHNDPKGTLQVVALYQKALDDSLKEFDSSADKDAYLQSKSEPDKNKIHSLIQRRNELKGLAEVRQK